MKTSSKSPKAARAEPEAIALDDDGFIELDSGPSRYDPGKRVLYVLDPNHQLLTRNRSLSVIRQDRTELISLPYRRIGRIEIGPGVSIARSVIDLSLEKKMDLVFVNGLGHTKGTLNYLDQDRGALQYAQARAILALKLRCSICKSLVEARIRNQRTQLMRLNRSRSRDEVAASLLNMKRTLRKLPQQQTVDEIRGIEGAASALYWPALGLLIDDEHDQTEAFRRTRPAKTPVNAAINYMTGILERDTLAAIHEVGLHPAFAFLHACQDNRPSLVFDLMEPFRAPLNEGLAIFLFNAKRLRPEMFATNSDGSIMISKEGIEAIIQGYESAVAKRINKTGEKGKTVPGGQ